MYIAYIQYICVYVVYIQDSYIHTYKIYVCPDANIKYTIYMLSTPLAQDTISAFADKEQYTLGAGL